TIKKMASLTLTSQQQQQQQQQQPSSSSSPPPPPSSSSLSSSHEHNDRDFDPNDDTNKLLLQNPDNEHFTWDSLLNNVIYSINQLIVSANNANKQEFIQNTNYI